jgi:hypothetical protein
MEESGDEDTAITMLLDERPLTLDAVAPLLV